jgi:uncharacterized protein YndB with AHSA1/START domain
MAHKKIRMEFPVKASPALLFSSISTPSGLSQWFCNDVDVYNDEYKFKWDGEEQRAKVLKRVANKLIRFHWVDSESEDYLELEITQDELTNDVALVITDFVEEKEEKEAVALWDSQIHDLRNSLGA